MKHGLQMPVYRIVEYLTSIPHSHVFSVLLMPVPIEVEFCQRVPTIIRDGCCGKIGSPDDEFSNISIVQRKIYLKLWLRCSPGGLTSIKLCGPQEQLEHLKTLF